MRIKSKRLELNILISLERFELILLTVLLKEDISLERFKLNSVYSQLKVFIKPPNSCYKLSALNLYEKGVDAVSFSPLYFIS